MRQSVYVWWLPGFIHAAQTGIRYGVGVPFAEKFADFAGIRKRRSGGCLRERRTARGKVVAAGRLP